MDTSGNTIIDGMATILWGSAWASEMEEAGQSLPAGSRIEEIMPPIPTEAFIDAAMIAGQIVQANGAGLFSLLMRAANADSAGDELKAAELFGDNDYARRFGECLAWQATGHGVSWFDDHADFDMEVPLCDVLATVDAAGCMVAEEVAASRQPGI